MDDTNQQAGSQGPNTTFEQRFQKLAFKIRTIMTHDALLGLLRDQLLPVFQSEMASIFLIDSLKMQLVSWLVLPGKSLRKIRIPINEVSIAGYAASVRQLVLIHDPYDVAELKRVDPGLRFDSSWDKQAGIRTRQILAVPIMKDKALLGVIQLMNKQDGMEFGEEDKRYIKELAKSLADTLLRLQKK